MKSRLTVLESLSEGPFKSVKPIESFRYVSIQPGGRKGTAKVLLITSTSIEEVAGIREASTSLNEIRAAMRRASLAPSPWPSEVLLGTACHHLAGAKTAARFVAADKLDDSMLQTMLRAAMKVEASPDESTEAVRETRLQV